MTLLTPDIRAARKADHEADQHAALYECGAWCPFFPEGSIDGGRCPWCWRFKAELADLARPECNEGELEPIDPE